MATLTYLDSAKKRHWYYWGLKLLQAGNLMALTTLGLRENNIGPAAQKALKQRYPKAKLTF